MITSLHARPAIAQPTRLVSYARVVFCPQCSKPLGMVRQEREAQLLLTGHCCSSDHKNDLQPSPAVPFS